MSAHSFEVGTQDFQQKVLEGSKNAPVLVDFWAEWCGPCRVLKPVLEKLAGEYGGAFQLAKLDVDQHQQLAAEFGVRGIPNVKAFVDGQLVDEFTGAQPERTVRAFIERLLPNESEQLRRAALERRDAGDSAGALQMLTSAIALDAGNDKARIDAAEIALSLGLNEQAKTHIEALNPLYADDARVQRIQARLQFAAGAPDEDLDSLRNLLAKNPTDLDARLRLANLLVTQRAYAQAMDELLEIIRRDRSFGDDAARKTMVSVFNLIADQEDLVSEYRRKLAAALH
jgi:putative thioredoxin